jgi:hypothetical protein
MVFLTNLNDSILIGELTTERASFRYNIVTPRFQAGLVCLVTITENAPNK